LRPGHAFRKNLDPGEVSRHQKRLVWKGAGRTALGLVSGRGRGKPMPKATTLLSRRTAPEISREFETDVYQYKFQTSASLQNKTEHLPQKQTPNPVTT